MGRAIYGVLYANQAAPLTRGEIRRELNLEVGQQEQFGRRMRELYRVLEIERTRRGSDTLYRLAGVKDKPHAAAGRINAKVRAQVLRDQRCAQCGRTPTEDHVRLDVDHKVPQSWGGTDNIENLQALCSECNAGKKAFYSHYNKYAEKIKQAANYGEPHKRIGEALKVFNGRPVRSDLLEMIAKAKQYQEDWQKRLRELRELGWKIRSEKKKEDGRIVAYYRLLHYKPWPKGSVAAEIRHREKRKKPKR